LVFLVASFSLAFPPITYTRSSSPPFVLHAPHISSSSTSLFKLYLAKSTNDEALHYVVFSILLSPHLSSVQISSSAPRFQPPSPSLWSSLNVRDQVSHPYRTTGKIVVLCGLLPNYYYSMTLSLSE
jgi:hypothetical protein